MTVEADHFIVNRRSSKYLATDFVMPGNSEDITPSGVVAICDTNDNFGTIMPKNGHRVRGTFYQSDEDDVGQDFVMPDDTGFVRFAGEQVVVLYVKTGRRRRKRKREIEIYHQKNNEEILSNTSDRGDLVLI